ncbi:MAG: Dinucleotide-utilizing enzymes involved in molybdopterin and thiamine biosynthesis family 1 [Candidatus Burkholderia crenata]|nr:Dinucleotide-utilizing enzyme involved in molybdopterin and thiamine biosynthesis family 1 [Candidatus Burkholderia crenata]CAH2812894.1 MAG: Dinucleotide-utilizing enzymes involved in molybdopterin and thiamine biosynthesis family 1 [Candidatus Burkholderia crenata]
MTAFPASADALNFNSATPKIEAADRARRFGGVARLYGPAGLAAFERAHVAGIGIGGVGSWTVEVLARNAIGRLTLIDLDNVAESNINRQVHALDGNYGKAKVSAVYSDEPLIYPKAVALDAGEATGSEETAPRCYGIDRTELCGIRIKCLRDSKFRIRRCCLCLKR